MTIDQMVGMGLRKPLTTILERDTIVFRSHDTEGIVIGNPDIVDFPRYEPRPPRFQRMNSHGKTEPGRISIFKSRKRFCAVIGTKNTTMMLSPDMIRLCLAPVKPVNILNIRILRLPRGHKIGDETFSEKFPTPARIAGFPDSSARNGKEETAWISRIHEN